MGMASIWVKIILNRRNIARARIQSQRSVWHVRKIARRP